MTVKPQDPDLANALAYLAKHPTRYLFPLVVTDPMSRPKGQPAIKNNLALASNDPAQLKRWYAEHRQRGRILWGCAAKKSGLVPLDVDRGPGKVGQESLDALRKEKPLPKTELVETPSGGLHYIYEGEHHFCTDKLGKNIDVPNYILIAGTTLDDFDDSRVYKVKVDAPVAKLPEWIAAKIKPRSAERSNNPPLDPIPLDVFKRMLKATPYTGGPKGLDDRHNYQGWLTFLMECHEAAGGDEGEYLDAVIEWSLADPNPDWTQPTSAEYIERKWQSFTADPPPQAAARTRGSWLKLLAALGQTQFIGDANPAETDFADDPMPESDDGETAALDKIVDWWKLRDQIERQEKYDHRDFLLYVPGPDRTKFIFTATGSEEFWSASAVNLKCKPLPIIDPRKKGKTPDECEKIDGTRDQFMRAVDKEGKPVLDKDGKPKIVYQRAADWIIEHPEQHVVAVTWWPGKPSVIRDTIVVKEGGVIPKKGMHSFNRYRPPRLSINTLGDPTRWLDHLRLLYPDDWNHIRYWLAHRVQHPDVKIHHALVVGGPTRIGKDRLLHPLGYAIGPWNFASTNAQTIMDEPKFTPYLESVICLIHEAKDFGDDDRYKFYHRIKPWLGGSAVGVLMSADKNVRAHAIIDVFAPIITTNHKLRGLYIPPDDARIYFAWSKMTRESMADALKLRESELDKMYFAPLQKWYESGGYEAVAHYLRTLDLTTADFSPTAPPPKTEAWHEVVDAGRDHTENAVARIIDELGNPAAITVDEVRAHDDEGELDWTSAKGRNQVAPQMESAGYVKMSNPALGNKSGRWMVGPANRRREIVIYGRANLDPKERRKAALEVFDREAVKAKKPTDKDAFA